jgi:hypothetical protein
MEKENLSQSFIQRYEALSDSFVIVERENVEQKTRKFEPFSFFRFRNKEQKVLRNEESVTPQIGVQPPPPPAPPTPPVPPQPPRPPRPQPIPPQNTPVILARDIYNKLRILKTIYQSLEISDPENAEAYNALVNETLILETTMLSIYQLLGGNNFVPNQNQTVPILTGNICADLVITQNYIQDILDNVLALQRIVNISNVDRQLAIISATLLSQKSRINTLQMSCGATNG